MNKQAARQVLERARAVREDSGAPVPSPCNAVCRMDQATGWCLGCLRSLDEIAAWGALADPQRRAVWRRLEARAAQAAADHGPEGTSR
jgi:uncharacterized protein